MLRKFKILLLVVYVHFSGIIAHQSYAFTTNTSCSDISQHPSWPLLGKQDCGKVKKGVRSRIMSGEDADLAEFPWMALLIYEKISNNSLFPMCGGSIISERYILTAAHCCVDDAMFKLAHVTLGDYDKSKEPDCVDDLCAPPTVNITIDQVIVHSAFDYNNKTDDICLLRLKEKISFTEFVSPICLPTSCEIMNKNLEGMDLEMAGWGQTQYEVRGLKNNPILQKGKFGVISLEECNKLFFVNNETIFTARHSQICTLGDPFIEPKFCQGDSGSPLMYFSDTTSTGYVVGLASFSKICSLWADMLIPRLPSVYSRVDYYLPWILDNIKA